MEVLFLIILSGVFNVDMIEHVAGSDIAVLSAQSTDVEGSSFETYVQEVGMVIYGKPQQNAAFGFLGGMSFGHNPCTSEPCLNDGACVVSGVSFTCQCYSGFKGTVCETVCDSQHYGANCDKACASRHCRGSSSCNSSGDCDIGCETGWTLTDCTEEARVLQAAYNAVHLAVVVADAFVVGVVVGAVVCFVFWWRRNRRPHKTSESPPTNASDARNDQSQNSDDVGTETRIYDSLHAESPHDAKITGETYCTIKSGNTDSEAHAATSRNLSESAGAQMYENIDHTSRKMDGAYSANLNPS